MELGFLLLWTAGWFLMLCALVAGIIWTDAPGHYRSWIRRRREAEQRGRDLLERWLSPAQLEQYRAHRYFDVIGGDSGRRYRVRQGRQMNIDELDDNGRPAAVWCFLPVGPLPTGDILLAQKIALENEEQIALAIAHKNPA
jgi:hypothetical protein